MNCKRSISFCFGFDEGRAQERIGREEAQNAQKQRARAFGRFGFFFVPLALFAANPTSR
jgi:hypothetical protein